MSDLSVVIVKGGQSTLDFFDDTLLKFNNRVCYGALNALQILEDSPAHVVVTEMDVGDMNGIELAEALRDIDSERDHFTYIILIGAANKERVEQDSFHQAIDVITGTKRVDVLEHLIIAGTRMSDQINRLKKSNQSLHNLCTDLRKGQLLDPLTGIGNREYAEQALGDTIRQVDSRGGAACLVMISIDNYSELKETFDTKIAGELIISVSERLRSLVRPLDVVTYFQPGLFALVLLQPSIDQCTAECYTRIFDGVRLKSYSTSAGFQPVRVGMSLCAATTDTGIPSADQMTRIALDGLPRSLSSESIIVHHIKAE